MKDKILQEFLNSNLIIKSKEKLIEYIDFCIDNDQGKKIKSRTEHHHILLKNDSCFPEYINLNKHKWNGTHLLYEDHYMAHKILAQAIDDINVLYSWHIMSGRENNIDSSEYRILKEKLIKNNSKLQKIRMESEGILRGAKCSKTKQSKEWKDTQGKICKELHNKTVMSKIISNGVETTRAKEISRKAANTMKKVVIVDGKETCIYKEARKKAAEANKKFYIVKNINGSVLFDKVSTTELNKISTVLINSSEENYFGKHKQTKTKLLGTHREYLIGAYAEKL